MNSFKECNNPFVGLIYINPLKFKLIIYTKSLYCYGYFKFYTGGG